MPRAVYTSPARPADIGYIARSAGVAIDWDATDIGPDSDFTLATRRYAFISELPAPIVAGFELKRI